MWIGDRTVHRLGLPVGALALLVVSLLAIAARASADEVLWINTNSIGYSQLDDSSGGFLASSVGAVHGGRGAAIDTTNSRIYVAQESTDQIAWFGLEGGSAGVVKTAPGSVDHPTNLTIDPRTQTLYWANAVSPGSIGYAFVNESGGGILAHSGSTTAHIQDPTRLAIDMRHDRLYWWNETSEDFSWVTLNGLVGGNLSTPGLKIEKTGLMGGIVLEPWSNPEEIFFIDNKAEGIFHTDPLLGGAPEKVQGAYEEENAKGPTGLAFDSTVERFYWANSLTDEEPLLAIGTATLFGHPNTLRTFPVAPVHSPVFATILKAPEVLLAPQLSVSGTTLSCTLGVWAGDQPGASIYSAPTGYGYLWRRGNALIPEATGASYTATESGAYSCEVEAMNAAGATAKKSASMTLTFPAKPKTATTTTTTTTTKATTTATAVGSAKLASGKPVKVTAGGTAAVSVDLVNSGKAALGSTKVCGKLTKQAKRGLKTPACVSVKSVAAGKTVVAKLKVKTLASARGTYKFTVAMSGAMTASLPAKVQVAAKKGGR